MDTALEDKLNGLIAQWEEDEPGVSDVDTPPQAPPGETVLPEMDFSPKPPPEPVRMQPEPVRIKPATVGAGAVGGLPRGGAGSSPVPSAKPTASPDTLDWKELGDRLAQANRNTEVARSSEHYLENAANSGQYRARTDYGGEMQAAKMPLELAQAKQGLERGQLSNDLTRSKISANAAEHDANSLESQKARAWVKSVIGETVPLPADFDNWSAADVKRFVSTGDIARIQAVRNAREDDARKVREGQEKAAAAAAALENSRKAFAPQLRELGIDPTRASEDDIKLAVQVGHNRATEAQAKAQYALAAKGEQRKEGEAEALKGSVPFANTELHYTGTGTPREEDRREAQKTAAAYGAAIAGMDDMSARLDDFAKKPSPATKAALDSSAKITAGHLNTAYGQGAMSKDEAEGMAKTLGAQFDPVTGFQFVIDKIVGDDPAAAEVMKRRLNSAKQNTTKAALAKTKAYHYEPAASPTPATETPDIPEDTRVIGGKTYRKKNGKWVTDA